VRSDWERQKYFPLQLATGLSRQFATHGLHFFKVNKTFTHVSVARPQFLDLETTPVSESIKSIVGHINTHPKCTRRQLIEALAPSPKKPTVIEIKPAAPAATVPAPDASGEAAAAPQDSSAAPAAPTAPAADEPTPEQTVIIADLHWLVHQGHVLEFADGRMDTAKKPVPRPPKPEAKPTEAKPATEGEAAPTTVEPEGETPILTEAEIPASEPEPAVEPEPAAEATAETPVPAEPAADVPASEPATDASADEPAAEDIPSPS
jgi:hypothetical protein